MKKFELKNCGIIELDFIKDEIVLEYNAWRKQYLSNGRNESLVQKSKQLENKLLGFRMKMAYNKAMEFIESDFGWIEIFDQIKNELKKIENDV